MDVPGLSLLPGGMITRPVRERSKATVAQMVRRRWRPPVSEEPGLLSLSSADHSEIAEITRGLADQYEGTNTGLSCPRPAWTPSTSTWPTSCPQRTAFRLTFAPEGGSERIRKVINKDGHRRGPDPHRRSCVRRRVAAGESFCTSCGLPTETDEDVVQIAAMAKVIRTGREVSGRRDIRCTVSIRGFVPKPHPSSSGPPNSGGAAWTPGWPFAQRDPFGPGLWGAGRSGSGITTVVRGSWRPARTRGPTIGAVIEQVCATVDGSTGGASTSASTAGWPLPTVGIDVDWYTTRA